MKRKLTFVLIVCMTTALIITGCAAGAPIDSADALEKAVGLSRIDIPELEKMLGGEMTLAVEGRDDNKLVYIHKYNANVGDVTSKATEIAEAIEEQREGYEGLVADLSARGVKNAAVVLEYWDADGTLIYSVTIS